MKTFEKNTRILLFVFLISVINSACEKDTEFEPLSGQLMGEVLLYGGENQDASDNSGVEIIVEGSDPEIITSTDLNGQFKIENLESGTYNIVFKKEGYCEYKIIGYQFVGGNKPATLYQIPLFVLPDLEIDNLEITDLDGGYAVDVKITAKVSNDNDGRSFFRYYLSNEPDVSYENYISTGVEYNYFGSEDMVFYLRIDTAEYPTGSKLYMIMYPASESSQYYTDINTGKKIYTTINRHKPSEIANLTIPEVENPWGAD